MAHEQSETIQNKLGKWENVYGRSTGKGGQRLPGTREYETVEEAVRDAQLRSYRQGEQDRIIRESHKPYRDYGLIDQDIIHKRK